MSTDKPSAFKNWINADLVQRMGTALKAAWPEFDRKKFMTLSDQLKPLELKQRVQLVREHLKERLPKSYSQALKILLHSLDDKTLKGFDLWPYTDFVQTYGLNEPKESLEALAVLTERFTSEFAVRPFLKQHTKITLDFLHQCAVHNNVHRRRWASEGSRPRLPWGERLELFINQPKQTLPLLEKLKHDPELYVRKSVANHLNDISKDHPDLVIQTLNKWQQQTSPQNAEKINWIIRHALRTLIKRGNAAALGLLGAPSKTLIRVSGLKLNKKNFEMGEALVFEFVIQSTSSKKQKLIIDYVIDFARANKATSAKVFKLKTVDLAAAQTITIQKSHPLREVTTRKHYPGKHGLGIQINGNIMVQAEWWLKTF